MKFSVNCSISFYHSDLPLVCDYMIDGAAVPSSPLPGSPAPPQGSKVSVDEWMFGISAKFRESGSHGSARVYGSVGRSLGRFIAESGEWSLASTTRDKLMAFSAHLAGRRVARNTISFYMRPLRASLIRAAAEGLVGFDPGWFADIYTGVDATLKRAISEADLRRLASFDTAGNEAELLVRDVFMFSFYMRGMAFADIARLSPEDIEGDILRYSRRKTGARIAVRIEPAAMAIVERWAGRSGRFLFPLLRDDSQRAYESALRLHNKRLKLLARKAGISTRLTSYVSRHTWATIASRLNVPIAVISAGMGHTSERTTRIYLDSISNDILDEANRLVAQAVAPEVK